MARILRIFRDRVLKYVLPKRTYAKISGVTIGKNCRILTTFFGTEPFLIAIGDRVTVADGTRFLTHEGSTWLIKDEKGRRYKYGRIVIEDEVFIGADCILLPGVKIGRRSIVGAGSVVTKSIPSGTIAAGNPAKVIGRFKDYETKVLAQCRSESEIDFGLPYFERVLKVVDSSFSSEITADSNDSGTSIQK